MIFSKV